MFLQIQFVDYGNIETCSASELRAPTILVKVPTLSRKYRIQHMKPITDNGVWPVAAIDLLHALIIEKNCFVSCEAVDTPNCTVRICTMKVDSSQISEILVRNGLATISNQYIADEKVDILIDAFEDDDFEHKNPNGTLNFNDYKAMFEKKKFRNANILKSDEDDDINDTKSNSNQSLSYSFEQNLYEDVVLDEETEHSGELDLLNSTSSSLPCTNEFQPNGTSTENGTPTTIAREYPQFTDLQLDTAEFLAQAVMVTDPLRLWVCPQTHAHKQRMRNMAASIQQLVTDDSIPDSVTIGMMYLARYKADDLFYRAKVKSYDSVVDEVTIVFVDYMNCAIIRMRDLRACPSTIQQLPISIVQVQLHGLRVNPRMREFDVERKLQYLLQDVVFTVRLMNCTKTLPEVDLLTDSHLLIYQSMVADRFYLQKNAVA